jgi:hypothetical protein
MSKNRAKVSIVVDKEINNKLENENYNKSKLINSLLVKWLKFGKNNLENFVKRGD